MTIFIIVFLIIVAILALWGISNLIAIIGGSPPIHTSLPTCYEILKKAGVTEKDTIIDLGSGTGNILLCAAKYFKAKSIGYEISPFPYLISRCRSLFMGHLIRVHFASIFEANLADATVIYIYLLPKMLLSIFSKIKIESKPGTIIVTRGFPLPNWQPTKRVTVGHEKTKIFIYQVK